MWILPLFSVAAGFIWLSATLQDQGFRWASQVCISSWGLCGFSEWLLVAAGVSLVAYLFHRRIA
jgi:hypothetical protein